MTRRKRYVQVGVGGRAWGYTAALVKTMKSTCELVDMIKIWQGRTVRRGGRPLGQLAELSSCV